jgi:hypothetical protein
VVWQLGYSASAESAGGELSRSGILP